MFKLSNQNDYTLCSQYDPALDVPQIGDPPDESDEEATLAFRARIAERDEKMKPARERGGDQWVLLTKPGGSPTKFNFRQVPGPAVTWWHNEIQRKALNHASAVELMFRLAIKSVENLGTYKAEVVPNEEGHQILTLDSLSTLYAVGDGIGRRVVFELGSVVLGKTVQRITPLS